MRKERKWLSKIQTLQESWICNFWNLWGKVGNVWKWLTRIFPSVYPELQEYFRSGRRHADKWACAVPTYPTTCISLKKVWLSWKFNWDNREQSLEVNNYRVRQVFFCANDISNQNRVIHRSMRKPLSLKIRNFSVCLSKLNKYLGDIPSSN